jgi:acetyl esterase/lipase
MKSFLLLAAVFSVLAIAVVPGDANETILLWPDDPELNSPDKMGVAKKSGGKTRVTGIGTPHLDAYLAKGTSEPTAAVILCPGGGYSKLVPSLHWPIAEWLNEQGVSAFILMYRCPVDKVNNKALPDIQRAIRIVRSRAAEWNINPEKIGLLGTSAGGNLGARASVSFGTESYPPRDKVDRVSARPDFTILLFPAYLAHRETKNPAPWIKIPGNMAPTLIIAARDDTKHFPSSPIYEAALKKAGAPVETHYFDNGGHGFSLREPASVSTWPERCLEWLRTIRIL